MKWYKLAAKQGYPKAQYNLGVMYVQGHGVPKDVVYAYMWAYLAAGNGEQSGAEARDMIAKRMTSAQIVKAQRLASECVRKEYKGCESGY